ncbi:MULTISPECIES: conjugal transfer protein [Bacillota]|uniref:conjugal transfer protein n=1 Tax=Bacillota TaxID=1239 RepID=UPI0039EF98AE
MINKLKFKSKKPFKAKALTVTKYVFWAFVILTFVRGMNSWVNNGETMAQTNNEIPYVVSGAAQGFAEAFSTDYLTFIPDDNQEYLDRVQPYLASSLRTNIPLDLAAAPKMTVEAAHVIDFKQINNEKADIFVKVDIFAEGVKPTLEEVDPTSTEEKLQSKKLTKYLQVPVAYKDKKLFIYDYPTFVNLKEDFKGEVVTVPELSSVDAELQEVMEKMTTDFFKTYSEGSSSQLAIYMLNGNEIKGYEGSLTFTGMNSVQVFDFVNEPGTEEKAEITEVVVYADSAWEDPQTKIVTDQHHTLLFKKENDRWLIKQFSGGWKQWK